MAGQLVKLADVSHILPLYPFYLHLSNYQPICRGSTMFQPNIIIKYYYTISGELLVHFAVVLSLSSLALNSPGIFKGICSQ